MRRPLPTWSLLLWAGLLTLGCAPRSKGGPAPAGSGAKAKPPGREARELELLTAEHRRDSSLVLEEDWTARVPSRREAAVRALARIQDERALEPLTKALGDEDMAVVSWAALGLGALCSAHEPELVRRLVLRAAVLSAQGATGDREQALGAIALALGRCASDEAERSLRSWLRQHPELSEAAALGLGRVARERKRLDDATVAALLDAAEKEASKGAFFYPLESLPSLGQAARLRLLEVARKKLEEAGPARAFAARALAKAGPEAAEPLTILLNAEQATSVERADAARALGGLGPAGQRGLASALAGRSKIVAEPAALLSDAHGVLLAVLDALEPGQADPGLLAELARLPLENESPPLKRRKVMIRCRAAALLAGRASASATLLACDPAPPPEQREGSLAVLRVLGRGSLAGARGKRFKELAIEPDRLVREAALELLMTHDELPQTPELLASALSAKEVGVRATAAKVLTRYPARAGAPPERDSRVRRRASDGDRAPGVSPPDPRVVSALLSSLAVAAAGHNIELTSLLIDASAALELLGAKPLLEQACGSANATLRQHAERGLAALGERKRRCPIIASTAGFPSLPAARDHQLELETDVGKLGLTLSGDHSPFATERVLELTRSGFYDGMLVHRAVPGFVIQFGDPDGDGFGGPELPPLPCQPNLEPFEAASVGVALSGRDTGASQLFVSLRRAPHLDGDYSLVGRAGAGWERLSAGDRILKVRVIEQARD